MKFPRHHVAVVRSDGEIPIRLASEIFEQPEGDFK